MNSFGLSVKREIDAALVKRVSQSMTVLVQELTKAYDLVFTVKGGNAGKSLTYEIKQTERLLEVTLGPSEAGKYLAYLEFGERGTQGGTGLYTRSKAPPVRNIYQWIRLAGIATPQFAIDRAMANRKRAASKRPHPKFDAKSDAPWYSKDPTIIFAFFIAQKRKKFGRPALRVFERTVQAQTARLQDYING